MIPESETAVDPSLAAVETESVEHSALSDDRANVPVSVVTERFLRAIVDKVPLDRLEELHLFSPLRQGTIETGIAVIAARVNVVEEAPAVGVLDLGLDAADSIGEVVPEHDGASADAGVEAPRNALGATSVEQVAADAEVVAETLDDERIIEKVSAVDLRGDEPPSGDDSPYADEILFNQFVAAETVVDEIVAEHEPAPEPPPVRHTVYTARYRLVVKGPERGRWEIEVVDEADAPLLAVATVVRGVQRRAGEETATVRYDAAQLARVLRLAWPAAT